MKPHLIAKLDIKIIQDWDPIRKLAVIEKSMMEKSVDENDYLMKDYLDNYSVTYMGALSEGWTIHGGNLLKDHMPWYKNFLEIVKPLQYDGCGFQIHTKSILEHADDLACYSDSPEKHNLVPDGQCKINYVISSNDPDAVTTVTDRDNPTHVKEYPSESNVAWLLDISHPHRLRLDGYREVLSFKFCEKFETVLKHFERLGPLTLG